MKLSGNSKIILPHYTNDNVMGWTTYKRVIAHREL
jgi:hypothetical protein